MPFRDDREALRARAEELEKERDEALRELGRLQVDHREASEEAEALQKKVRSLEKERAGLGGVRPTRRWALWAVAGGTLAIGIAVLLLRQGVERDQYEVRLAATRLQADEARAQAAEARRRAEEIPAPPVPEPSVPVVPVEPRAPPAPRRTYELTWRAKVRRVEGHALRVGSPCTLRAVVSSDGSDMDTVVDVVCGETTIYDWEEPLGSGMQVRSCNIGESPDARGFAYTLRCSDTGPRTGRPQLSVDTAVRVATVWREGLSRVELTVPAPARREGESIVGALPLSAGSSGFAAIAKQGRVTRATGAAPTRIGETCAVLVTPGEAPHPCKVMVACGRPIYGGGPSNGFVDCVLENGAPVTATDSRPTHSGGDPMLDLDLRRRSAVVRDEAPDWSVTISLR